VVATFGTSLRLGQKQKAGHGTISRKDHLQQPGQRISYEQYKRTHRPVELGRAAASLDEDPLATRFVGLLLARHSGFGMSTPGDLTQSS
jgi:hypothetical protein